MCGNGHKKQNRSIGRWLRKPGMPKQKTPAKRGLLLWLKVVSYSFGAADASPPCSSIRTTPVWPCALVMATSNTAFSPSAGTTLYISPTVQSLYVSLLRAACTAGGSWSCVTSSFFPSWAFCSACAGTCWVVDCALASTEVKPKTAIAAAKNVTLFIGKKLVQPPFFQNRAKIRAS